MPYFERALCQNDSALGDQRYDFTLDAQQLVNRDFCHQPVGLSPIADQVRREPVFQAIFATSTARNYVIYRARQVVPRIDQIEPDDQPANVAFGDVSTDQPYSLFLRPGTAASLLPQAQCLQGPGPNGHML